MAYYAQDITFAIGDPAKSDMDALHSSVRRINGPNHNLWFGIKENFKELWDGPLELIFSLNKFNKNNY